jgi:hypothetical protein
VRNESAFLFGINLFIESYLRSRVAMDHVVAVENFLMKRVIGLSAAMLIMRCRDDVLRGLLWACAILWLMGLWLRRVGEALVVLGVLLVLLYVGDWLVLRVRVSHGTAYRVVSVNQFLATPLKGSKVEYDLMGTVPVTCSRSIFPQQGDPACWWLEKHTSQWE